MLVPKGQACPFLIHLMFSIDCREPVLQQHCSLAFYLSLSRTVEIVLIVDYSLVGLVKCPTCFVFLFSFHFFCLYTQSALRYVICNQVYDAQFRYRRGTYPGHVTTDMSGVIES